MPKRNLIWILAIVAATAGTALVTWSGGSRGTEQRGFDPVHETYRLIFRNYYRPIEGAQLQRVAVQAMAESLDEFSSYVDPCNVEAFSHRVHGLGQGLGLRLTNEQGRWLALAPLLGSPAHLAGIGYGDQLLAVEGHQLDGLTAAEVRTLLDGPLGSQVTVQLLRCHADEPQSLQLTRSEFALQSVEGIYRDARGRWVYQLDGAHAIAYIRVSEVVSDSAGQFLAAYRQLGDANSLILDLRDNPGGLLPVAVSLADMFLAQGEILTILRRDEPNQVYAAKPADTLPIGPVVVLVDAQTASAAEIVAGALAYHHRAVLVGSRTRGKGCIQSMFTLSGNLGHINLTTSEFLVGADKRIMRQPGCDQWGIDPHEQRLIDVTHRTQLARLRELARSVPREEAGQPAAPPAALVEEILALDAPLARAVEILADRNQYDLLLEEARRRDDRAQAPSQPQRPE